MTHHVLQMTKDLLWLFTSLLILLVSPGCKKQPNDASALTIPKARKVAPYPVFIETPVGELQTISFDLATRSWDTLDLDEGGLKHDYLPYPLNAGFIPLESGEDVQKQPVWVLGDKMMPGDTLGVYLLGMVQYVEGGLTHEEFLAIPADSDLQTIAVKRFRDFVISYDPVKFMFETWMENRHGIGSVSQISWLDEDKAGEKLAGIINYQGQ